MGYGAKTQKLQESHKNHAQSDFKRYKRHTGTIQFGWILNGQYLPEEENEKAAEKEEDTGIGELD